MFDKSSFGRFAKGIHHQALGAIKGGARFINDHADVLSGIAGLAGQPEIGAAIQGAKRLGILEKIKNA